MTYDLSYDQGNNSAWDSAWDPQPRNWAPVVVQSDRTVGYDAAAQVVIKQVRRMDLEEGDLVVLEQPTNCPLPHAELVRLLEEAGALADRLGVRFLVLPPGVTLAGVVAGAKLEMEDSARLFDHLRGLQARLDAATGSAEEPV